MEPPRTIPFTTFQGYEGAPSFSPDGNEIVFDWNGETGDNWDIYRKQTGLTWTADGREILFSTCQGDLWRVPASGGTPIRYLAAGETVVYPSISSQGNRLAYTRLTPVQRNIWRLPGPKSTEPVRLPEQLISSSQRDANPDVSPDGRKIAFESNRTGKGNIWVCDSDGSNPRALTSFEKTSWAGTPRWSPDGKQIAFDSRQGDNAGIFVIAAGGGEPRRLTHEGSDDIVPTWSRDGIYFRSNRSGEDQIWKVPSTGGEPLQVTQEGGYYAVESFSRKSLFYAKPNDDGIWKIPVSGGNATRILHRKISWDSWAVARDGIYFFEQDWRPTVRDWAVEFLSFQTGKVTTVFKQESRHRHAYPTVSPDGEWFLYSESPQREADIVLVENFR